MQQQVQWRKSSHSNDDSNYHQCVELGDLRTAVGIRDSKQSGRGPVLSVSRRGLANFLGSVKAGTIAS